MKTLLTLFTLAVCAVGLMDLLGCASTTTPDLVTYREGLHAVDAPLYAQHTQLMTDAVAKGIRTPADQSIVAAEINQANSIYNTSKSHDSTSTSATTATPAATTTGQ